MADGTGLVCVRLPLFVPVYVLRAAPHALLHGVRIVSDAVARIPEALPDAVVHPELQWVKALPVTDVIDLAVRQEDRLRHAIGTHCAGGGGVCEDRRHVRAAAIGVVVEILVDRCDGGCNRVSVGGVRAFVRVTVEGARKEAAVCCVECLRLPDHSVADSRLGDAFLSGGLQADAPAAADDRQIGVQRFIQDVLLVAEASAKIRLDHADLADRPAQRLSDDTAHDVRDLGRGCHRDLSVYIYVCPARCHLNMAV